MREEIFTYIKRKYKTTPEYLWAKDNTSAVFRHSDNRKWFALAMCVGKIGRASGRERVWTWV